MYCVTSEDVVDDRYSATSGLFQAEPQIDSQSLQFHLPTLDKWSQ